MFHGYMCNQHIFAISSSFNSFITRIALKIIFQPGDPDRPFKKLVERDKQRRRDLQAASLLARYVNFVVDRRCA